VTSFTSSLIHSGWLRRSNLIAALTFAASVLAVSTRSEAKIVYTAVDVTANSGHIKFDLNHDGIKDFDIQAAANAVYCGTGGGVHGVVTITPTTGNGVVVSGGFLAAALGSGISVGPALAFQKYQSLMTNFLLSRGCGGSYRDGNWCSGFIYYCSRTAYLGLKFVVNGQTHYGWAYVIVSGSITSGLTVTLRGFAYETIAGYAITTGQTSGT